MRYLVKDLIKSHQQLDGNEVTVNGWIRSNRDQKAFGFIVLNDGSHFVSVQIVYERESLANYNDVAKYRAGAAVTVIGKLVLTPDARQAFEIHASDISLVGDSLEDYPIQPKRHTREFLREVAHLRMRTNLFSAVFRVRSILSYAIHRYFQEAGFLYVHTPIITASDAEGAGECFRVTVLDDREPPLNDDREIDYTSDFFGRKTNLTVSGQLEAEAYALAFSRVYTFGPTFRAENSNTARHAAEFWMIEPEIAFAGLSEDMDLAEDMMKYLIRCILDEAPDEMAFFNEFTDKGLLARLHNVLESDFARISYSHAIDILTKSGDIFEYPVKWGVDLQTEHEKYLTEHIFKKPVFVTDYPASIKAFYMRQNDDGRTVAAMDMLVPGVGELIGGSQREERLDRLEERMNTLGMDSETLWWYMDLRRYGGVPHAGFGLGFERLIMYLTGVGNIRDVIPFPRTVRSCDF